MKRISGLDERDEGWIVGVVKEVRKRMKEME